MRVSKLRLHPFAGQADFSVDFKPGLNVISGPNEAGKSTLLNALQVALLTPIKVGKRDWEKDMQRFMPLAGDDTIRLSLEFNVGGDFKLMKSWGGNSSAYLKMPEGEVIEDPLKVETRLAELLELKPGTWRNVLFAGQQDLTSTLAEMDHEGEEFSDLAAWLRKSAFATDGISIEKLGDSLEQQIEAYEDHWDVDYSRPEKSRGIDNPWEKKVGRVLKAWYLKESIQRDHNRVESYERDLDAITARTNECIKRRDKLSDFVSGHATAIADADERALLEAKKRALVAEGKELKKVSLGWPKFEERQSNLKEEELKLKQQVGDLDGKLKAALVYEKNRSRRERLKRAEAKQEALKAAEEKLDKIKLISDQQLDDLQVLEGQVKRLETGLAAGKLKLKFSAKKAMGLEVHKDLEERIDKTVEQGEEINLDAGGRILLSHSDWELSVQSGDSDFSELKQQHQSARSKFEELLKALGETDIESARLAHRACVEEKREVETLKQQVNEVLDGESMEELKEALGGDDDSTVHQPSAEIAAGKAKLEASIENALRLLADIEKQLSGWIEDYESQENLLDLLVDKRGDLKAIDAGLSKLKPLPEGVEDTDEFIADFRSQERQLKQVMEQDFPNLKIERAQLEGNSPDQSLKDLEESMLDANAAFEQVQTEWKALLRIQEVHIKLRAEMDAGTLDPWVKKLRKLSGSLSGGRYEELHLNDSLVGSTSGGLDIPYESLSTGTSACLGLAVRLSMAQHFLEARDGFVVLDDPLVDLDPERQKAASLILKEFAKDKQLIVLTCHPGHAELIGGHLIEMGEIRN